MSVAAVFLLQLLICKAYSLPINELELEEPFVDGNFESQPFGIEGTVNPQNPLVQWINTIKSLRNKIQPKEVTGPRIVEEPSVLSLLDRQDLDAELPNIFGNEFEDMEDEMPIGDPLVTMYYMKVSPALPEDQRFFDATFSNITPLPVDKDNADTGLIQSKQIVDNEGEIVHAAEPRRIIYKPLESNDEWTWRQIWMSLLSICVFGQTIMLIYISKDVEKIRMSRIEKC